MSRPFVHLHVHSDYSLLDGACPVDRLVARANALGMPAVALTDHGNLFGAVQFAQQADKAKVRPIIGCELYVVPYSRLQKSSEGERRHHLVLLVENETGYRNLCRLVSRGYLDGFYYRPRVDLDLLAAHAEGLIALSSCLQGEVPTLLGAGEDARAEEAARRYQEMFGPGNFFLEIQDHGLPEQREVNARLVALSRRTGIPLVATNDCHYLEAEDALAQEVLICLQTGKTLSDEKRMQFPTQEFYFKSGEQMAALFPDLPEALDNTVAIAERCRFAFDFSSHHYPQFAIPAGQSLAGHFEAVTRDGWADRRAMLTEQVDRRYPLDAYEERLAYEVGVIQKLNYAGYFLIVWDFIRHAREAGIPVGPGRGSAAGSLVAYALGITDIDPLQYDLLFERFLNPERVSPPDIDIDFCTRRREEVIRYVTAKYGQDCVCQIITFNTMKARAVLRDVGRVLGMGYGEVDAIAKLVPQELKITLESALEKEERLRQAAARDPRVQQLLDISRRLEGFNRHHGIHAAGVVIAPRPLEEIIPLATGANGEVVTQYTMGDVERLGLLKMDFLGLITLTVIRDALDLIRRTEDQEVDIDRIPLDNEAAYRLLAEGRTAGVFQFESPGMRGYLKQLRPTHLDDLIAMNALYRPGPIKGGMVDDFIRRKHGQSRIDYLLPELEPILRPTYGVIVYQEQVMQIASQLAGFSLAEADELRKAMGKKIEKIMAEKEIKFIEGCVARGLDRNKATELFTLMRNFGEYGFNKSHSAAYAWLAYQTTYLKANHTVAYMAALLTSEAGNAKKVVQYIAECKALGIRILPPSINVSGLVFLPDGGGIRFGLSAIRNVGAGAIEVILNAREDGGPFRSLEDFCARVDLRTVNARVLDSLIKAGAFDEWGHTRATLSLSLERTIELAQRVQRDRAVGQLSLFDGLEPEPGEPAGGDAAALLPPMPEWPLADILAAEKEILGFYVSGHPLDTHAEDLEATANATAEQLLEGDEWVGRTVQLGCVMTALKERRTRSGERMGTVVLEDLTGSVDAVIFPKVFKVHEEHLHPDRPLLVKALYERDDTTEERRLVVQEVIPMSMARDRTVNAVRLEFSAARLSEAHARELVDLLLGSRGECNVEVLLRLPNGATATMQAHGALRVRWTPELKRRIEDLAHPGAIHYIA